MNVISMLHARTLLEASSVCVTKDTVEMGKPAMVIKMLYYKQENYFVQKFRH